MTSTGLVLFIYFIHFILLYLYPTPTYSLPFSFGHNGDMENETFYYRKGEKKGGERERRRTESSEESSGTVKGTRS